MQIFRDVTPKLLIFIFFSILFFLVSDYFVGVFDEGLILTGAYRVLNGEVPSRDFYANYGPAQFYILGYLFKIFGTNMLVARIYDSALSGLIVTITFTVARRQMSSWCAVCNSICVAALLIHDQNHLYPITPVILVSLLAAFYLIKILTRQDPFLAYLPLSVLLAVVMLFRYEIAVIMLVAIGIPIVLSQWNEVRESPGRTWFITRETLSIFLTLAVAPLATLIVLHGSGILAPALSDIIKYNLSIYVEMRSLPFPRIGDAWDRPGHFVIVYFSIVVSFISICILISERIRKKNRTSLLTYEQNISILVFTSMTMLFYTKGWVRISGIHLLLANVHAMILLFLIMDSLTKTKLTASAVNIRFRSAGYYKKIVCVISVSLFLAMLYANWTRSNPLYRNLSSSRILEELPALSIFSADSNRLHAAKHIVRNTTASDKILSTTGRHDKVFVNDASIYFITQRIPATRWHHYDPGVVTTAAVQLDIIEEVKITRPRVLVRVLRWDNIQEENKSAKSSNIFLLDRYLNENYTLESRYGDYDVYTIIGK